MAVIRGAFMALLRELLRGNRCIEQATFLVIKCSLLKELSQCHQTGSVNSKLSWIGKLSSLMENLFHPIHSNSNGQRHQ